ncbi:MAG: methylase, partial [Ruminococcus sp.]|nr:methylase [Ruminococcus sp.]
IKVSIGQFYGIEINDFAVTVAKTALWIAESQMLHETEEIMNVKLDFLPLKSYANIAEGNALRVNWEDVVSKNQLNYIMGNPPFVGATMMTAEQKKEAVNIFGKIKLSNSIDYVGAWYFKTCEIMLGTDIKAALVSTNSITQGEQVAPLWQTLFQKYNLHINFAYKTFRWDSEASLKAHVHCVIIGFSIIEDKKNKVIYENDKLKTAKNINAYLMDAPNIFIPSRSKPLCNVSPMILGNKPADGGNFIISEEEKNQILKREPQLEKFIRPYIGAVEFINRKTRFCFWLTDVTPAEISKSKELHKRLENVREMRLNSTALPTREKANTPNLFFFISQPETDYIIVPSTSSERRKYIPMGFLHPNVIASNSVSIIPNGTLYQFGILTSNVHMAWTRTVAGRLKSDYRYTGSIVYNNFPWCTPTDEQKAKIEQTAQAILDAREKYPECSLADLYDELTMPKELRKAHQNNDRAVMQAYGFDVKAMTESECVGELMKMYRKMTGGK